VTLAERVLCHQIHPLKLFTDRATAIIREVDQGPYRRGPMGAYLRRSMTPAAQGLRLFGAGLAFLAAWDHVSALMFAGLALVAACWADGLVRRRPA
jgi:hypothetical protein